MPNNVWYALMDLGTGHKTPAGYSDKYDNLLENLKDRVDIRINLMQGDKATLTIAYGEPPVPEIITY